MSEHHPEETMPVAASDLDCSDLPDELIDELLAGARTPGELTGPDGVLPRLTKRLVERVMAAELSEHLGYEHGEAPPGGVGNARNGTTAKTVHTGHGSVRIEQPRDRRGVVRAADRAETPAALRRLRRQDRGHVRARDVGA
jgi:Transposase, Mutator family